MKKLQVDIDELSEQSEPVTGFETYVYLCGEADAELAKKDARISALEHELKVARTLIQRLISDLPSNKDWLDPMLESALRFETRSL